MAGACLGKTRLEFWLWLEFKAMLADLVYPQASADALALHWPTFKHSLWVSAEAIDWRLFGKDSIRQQQQQQQQQQRQRQRQRRLLLLLLLLHLLWFIS